MPPLASESFVIIKRLFSRKHGHKEDDAPQDAAQKSFEALMRATTEAGLPPPPAPVRATDAQPEDQKEAESAVAVSHDNNSSKEEQAAAAVAPASPALPTSLPPASPGASPAVAAPAASVAADAVAATAVTPTPTSPENGQAMPPAAQGPIDVPLEAKAYQLESALAACSAQLGKLSNAVSPWDIKSNVKQVMEARAQFDRTRMGVKSLLQELLKEARYTSDAGPKLQERETLLVQTREQEAALQRSAQLQALQMARFRSMLAKVDQGKLARLESRGAAGGRFGATSSEETLNMLCSAVDAFVDEHRETKDVNVAAEKSKSDLSRKVKELQDKLRSEVEVRDRELQQLRAAVKRANEDKEAGIAAAKEQVNAQLSKKTADVKALQHRIDAAKGEVEAAKGQNKAMKAAMEQANASLAQSQEEARVLAKKLQHAKLQKDSVSRELEGAKSEMAMVFAELRQLQQSASAGGAAAAASASAFRIAPAYLRPASDAPFPRVAYSSRGGRVLHNGPCGAVETSNCVTLEYGSVAELEGHMREDGFVLCHTCRADPGF